MEMLGLQRTGNSFPSAFWRVFMNKNTVVLAVLGFVVAVQLVTAQSTQPIRVGLIGLDTSHVIAFTKVLNDPSSPDHVPGMRVVAAFKGGSPDVESSRTRVEGFTAELRDKWKVEIVADIPTLCRKVDAVLLESVDGRPHLEQVRPVLAAKKPVFIDKPLAASYRDAKEIARLAREAGVRGSALFRIGMKPNTEVPEAGRILGANVYGPAPTEPHHPDLMWYGIHAVEMLFAVMGPGCESVSRVNAEGADIVTGKWKDGRLGVVRGIRKGKQDYGIEIFGEKAILHSEDKPSGYRPLLVEIVKFFQTGVAPVNPDETLEMFAFMEAADESKAKGGAAVPLPK
jgi:predicted dehydrogenase